MSQKIIIIIGVAVLAILALFMFNGSGNQSVTSNILYITQPVNSFSGKVEKVNGNTVFVYSQYTLPQAASVMVKVVPGQPVVMPTPQVKTITYKVLVTDKTQISQPAPYINYLLKTVTPAPMAKLSIKDVKVGQMVTVNSTVDLRTLKGDEFEATTINLSQITNTLSGKVVSVTSNTLILKAFAPLTGSSVGAVNAPSASQEKEYRITLTSNTEISRMVYSANMANLTSGETPTPPKPEELTVSDLKKDMQATVYTAEDVTESQSLTALRIEPDQVQVMPEVVSPTPEANAPVSPTPSTRVLPSTKPLVSPTSSTSASPSIRP